ncbi:hypothetical protein [Verrucosispora sp. TAA-831]|uniref:hypothetical protein n=1 Tax=Verrucosispora sp. TAA-831 TaxID=3422227 RepID=UPI003D6F0042
MAFSKRFAHEPFFSLVDRLSYGVEVFHSLMEAVVRPVVDLVLAAVDSAARWLWERMTGRH